MDNLINALTDQASDIVAEVAETGTLTLSRLDAALLQVYGTEKTIDELERELQAVQQGADETLRAFATRLDRAGRKAMRGFREERIQASKKKAFLLGLRDRVQAAMLTLTNAATWDSLLSAIHRSHADSAISSIIEPLMKKAKVNHTDVELPSTSNKTVTVNYTHGNHPLQPLGHEKEDERPHGRKRTYTFAYPAPGDSRRGSDEDRETRRFGSKRRRRDERSS